jgi:uncharacterized membrane protein
MKKEHVKLGDRIADKVTAFMATWTFIFVFVTAGLIEIWTNHSGFLHFDPQTIILNLFLSFVAAVQGSIIMISQNRAAERDRKKMTHIENMLSRMQSVEKKLYALQESKQKAERGDVN